ncbi:unnamed protein product [Caenorhabditis nigoni]
MGYGNGALKVSLVIAANEIFFRMIWIINIIRSRNQSIKILAANDVTTFKQSPKVFFLNWVLGNICKNFIICHRQKEAWILSKSSETRTSLHLSFAHTNEHTASIILFTHQ